MEEEEEAPALPEEVVVQRYFSIESLCTLKRLNEHLESDLNRDIFKSFVVLEKEKVSKKWTRYDVIIIGLKGHRVQWPKGEEVCNNTTMIK